MKQQMTLEDQLKALAWKPGSTQEVIDEVEAAAAQGRRPARPGEQFRLVIEHDPSGHTRPAKRQPKNAKKLKMVKDPGLSVNDWAWADPMVRAKLADELVGKVAKAADAQQCPAFLNGKPYIRAVYFFGDRIHRDWANFGKQVIDALEIDRRKPNPKCPDRPKKPGIIRADSDDDILLDRNHIVTGDPNPRVEILLIDTRLMTADEVADLFRASALEQCQRLLMPQRGA